MKQTAEEWLFEKLPTIDKYDPYYADIIKQAKEMEKQQIKDSYEKVKKYKKPIKDSNPIWLNSKPYK